MKPPLLVSMNDSGCLQFHQDINQFAEIKVRASTVDVWVINHPTQYEDVQKCHRIFLMYNKIKDIIPATKDNLFVGTQVIYVPPHLMEDPDILDTQIQFGFVTSIKGEKVFCRYYSNYDLSMLRTMSCSELTSIHNLFLLKTRLKKDVNLWLKVIEREDKQISKKYQDAPWIRIRR